MLFELRSIVCRVASQRHSFKSMVDGGCLKAFPQIRSKEVEPFLDNSGHDQLIKEAKNIILSGFDIYSMLSHF